MIRIQLDDRTQTHLQSLRRTDLPAAVRDRLEAARKGTDQANELGDLDTADLFTEVSRGIDKWL